MIICYPIILSIFILECTSIEPTIDQTTAEVTENVLLDESEPSNPINPIPKPNLDNIQFTKQESPNPDIALKVLEDHDALLFQLTEYPKAKRFLIYENTSHKATIEKLDIPTRDGDIYKFKYLHTTMKETDSDGKTKIDKLEIKKNCVYFKNVKIHDENIYKCKYDWDGLSMDQDTIKIKQLKVVRIPKLRIDPREFLAVDSNKTIKVASCTASSARPKAELKWSFEPGYEEPKNWSPQIINIDDNFSIDHLTKTEINFVLEPKFNGKNIYCTLVNHPSLDLVRKSDNRDELMTDSPPRIAFMLDIKFKPEVPVIEAIPSENPNTDATNFKCFSNANPPAKYEWYLNDEYMTDQTETFDISDQDYDFNSTIKCTAKNTKGQESRVEIYSDLNKVYALTYVEQGSSVDMLLMLGIILIVVLVGLFILAVIKYFKREKLNSIPEYTDEEKDLKKHQYHLDNNESPHNPNNDYSKANLPSIVDSKSQNLKPRQFVQEPSSEEQNYEQSDITQDDTQNLYYTDIIALPDSDNLPRSEFEDLDKTYYDDPETRYHGRTNVHNTTTSS